jgi:4-diphosphocytidyl-2-C-methyl-D-erythritol kinase
VPASLAERAPAKVNLTLRVLGRRADGYHELESLVVFARVADRLTLRAGADLTLRVHGAKAGHAGPLADNLVLKAARALSDRIAGLKVGGFSLAKQLPSGAGLGGGSADAAAALRLLARVNRIDVDDARVLDAARASGADVPVCVNPRARVMRGIGEILSPPLALPPLPAVLVHPGIPVSTKLVFEAMGLRPGDRTSRGDHRLPTPTSCTELLEFLAADANDLERAAMAVEPVIAKVQAAIAALPGCRLARMSGSGSACFGLFDSGRAAQVAARALAKLHPDWWVRSTVLGSA